MATRTISVLPRFNYFRLLEVRIILVFVLFLTRIFNNGDMGFFDKLFGERGGGKHIEAVEDRILRIIAEMTAMECVTLHPVQASTKPWESKIGGVPYMPQNFVYPCEETAEMEKLPLRFLGQLNFGEMPNLPEYPQKGILQFYISGKDAYGLNFENPVEQKGFRVVFHEHVIEDETFLSSLMPTDDVVWQEKFPVSQEFKLTYTQSSMSMGGGDFRFDKILLDAYNQANPKSTVPSLDRAPESVLDKVYDRLDMAGHRVGGYPLFRQIDPREYHENLREHTLLLFQLDSDDTEILWGDHGVCNFFIRPEDLKNLDFSKVLYNWDCY